MKGRHAKARTPAATLLWSAALGATLVPAAILLSGWMPPGNPWRYLVVAAAGVVLGVTVGAVVWRARPRCPRSTSRLILTRALMGAGIAVFLLTATMAAWGFVSGWETTHAGVPPGVAAAMLLALGGLVDGGAAAGLVGASIGAIAAWVAGENIDSIS